MKKTRFGHFTYTELRDIAQGLRSVQQRFLEDTGHNAVQITALLSEIRLEVERRNFLWEVFYEN